MAIWRGRTQRLRPVFSPRLRMQIAPRENTCFFSGHRAVRREDVPALERELDLTLRKLAFRGFTDFVCGGALGFDTIAARRVLEAKKRDPRLRLILVLPCADQTARWRSAEDVATYEDVKKRADGIVVISDRYRGGVMMERNRAMADLSSLCVAYYDGRRGGGAHYTVGYAEKQGLEIINLLPSVREDSGKDGK